MTALTWDAPGSHRFETGVDRGVLYLPDGGAVPWNGLTTVTETLGREVKSYYLDGQKYLDHEVLGAYSAKLQAFTYPDELDVLTGRPSFFPGVILNDQPARPFSLCYRTRVGNDLEGTDHGYKLHLVYNVLATPSDTAHASLSQSPAAVPFEWTLVGTPMNVLGIRPTSHISLHSLQMDPDLLFSIEQILYGTNPIDEEDLGTVPELPDIVDLLAMAEEFYT